MENPLITIAIVTYNSEKFVEMAIESVLNSNYEFFELIISDDYSTDNTWNIISKYEDDRIIKIRNDKNIGEYANRNQCISKAKGKYFIFIDGDDIIYPHGLDFMVKMSEAFSDCGMTIMYPFDNRIIYPVILESREFYMNAFFGRGITDVAFTNTLFKTSVLLQEGGLSTKFKSGDDYIRLKIAAKNKTLIICDQLTWWRETPGQASQQLKVNKVLTLKELFIMSNNLFSDENCPIKEYKNQAKTMLLYKLKMQIRQSFKSIAIVQIFKLIRLTKILDSTIIQLLTSKKVNLDPFASYNPVNPFRMEFKENPFSIMYKK